jgi:hypothetical protein
MPIVDDGPVIDDGCRLKVVVVARAVGVPANNTSARSIGIANANIFLFIFFSSIFYMHGAFSC